MNKYVDKGVASDKGRMVFRAWHCILISDVNGDGKKRQYYNHEGQRT